MMSLHYFFTLLSIFYPGLETPSEDRENLGIAMYL